MKSQQLFCKRLAHTSVAPCIHQNLGLSEFMDKNLPSLLKNFTIIQGPGTVTDPFSITHTLDKSAYLIIGEKNVGSVSFSGHRISRNPKFLSLHQFYPEINSTPSEPKHKYLSSTLLYLLLQAETESWGSQAFELDLTCDRSTYDKFYSKLAVESKDFDDPYRGAEDGTFSCKFTPFLSLDLSCIEKAEDYSVAPRCKKIRQET